MTDDTPNPFEALTLYYLSFASDTGGPDGNGEWLGGLYLQASDAMDAVQKAHKIGQNPGGEVAVVEIPPEGAVRVRASHIGRLLNMEELRDAVPDARLMRINREEV